MLHQRYGYCWCLIRQWRIGNLTEGSHFARKRYSMASFSDQGHNWGSGFCRWFRWLPFKCSSSAKLHWCVDGVFGRIIRFRTLLMTYKRYTIYLKKRLCNPATFRHFASDVSQVTYPHEITTRSIGIRICNIKSTIAYQISQPVHLLCVDAVAKRDMSCIIVFFEREIFLYKELKWIKELLTRTYAWVAVLIGCSLRTSIGSCWVLVWDSSTSLGLNRIPASLARYLIRSGQNISSSTVFRQDRRAGGRKWPNHFRHLRRLSLRIVHAAARRIVAIWFAVFDTASSIR